MKLATNLYHAGKPLDITFYTGGAGTGKSHTLRTMIDAETEPYLTVAPTGLAATNVQGQTIHSAFKVDMHGNVRGSVRHSPVARARRIYIDEVSMVSDELMGCIAEALDICNTQPEIICFGDLAQLKPVQGSYFFNKFTPVRVNRLTTNYRQADDLTFAEILNRIRCGQVSVKDLRWLNERGVDAPGELSDYTTLAFSNETVHAVNAQALDKLPGAFHTNLGELRGNMKETEVQAPLRLALKVGATVLMLNNDKKGRWNNGTPAIVKEFVTAKEETQVVVEVKGIPYTITEHSWIKEEPTLLTEDKARSYEQMLEMEDFTPNMDERKIRKILRTGIDYVVVGSFTQLPMKLGFASTVHKSQGQTIDKVHIVPDGFGRMHGLLYVALSRLRSVEGLSLDRPLTVMDFKFDKTVKEWL